jgi:hypothetical protein
VTTPPTRRNRRSRPADNMAHTRWCAPHCRGAHLDHRLSSSTPGP